MSDRPAPVQRPNGKWWRGRKPMRVEAYVNYDEIECLIVLGTHDIEAATSLAQNSWIWSASELFLVEPKTDWWRLVPWDATGTGHDRNWIADPVGGTPCVVFDA